MLLSQSYMKHLYYFLFNLFGLFSRIKCHLDQYLYDRPDIISEMVLNNGNFLIVLEAFKSIDNEKILVENNNLTFSRLSWVSLGYPTLMAVLSTNQTRPKLFHFSSGGFHTYINMLTDEQRNSIREKIKLKYHIDVDKSQITNLIVNKFECKLHLKCGGENMTSLEFTGRVTDFRQFMLRLKFKWNKKKYQDDMEKQKQCVESKLMTNETLYLSEEEFSMTCQVMVNSVNSTSFWREFLFSMENYEQIILNETHHDDHFDKLEKNFGDLSRKNDIILKDINKTNEQFLHIGKVFNDFINIIKNKDRRSNDANGYGEVVKYSSQSLSSDIFTLTRYKLSQRYPSYENMQEIDLSSWNITQIHANTFRGVNNLNKLNLNINKLTQLNKLVFKGLADLETLHLNFNRLKTLPPSIFNDLSKLVKLTMSSNDLTSFSPLIFRKLKNLKYLDLSNNRLEILDDSYFEGLTQLERLDLNDNELTHLYPLLFNDLFNLKKLYLQANRLVSIDKYLFSGLINLKELDVSENRLRELDAGILRGLNSLEVFVMIGNEGFTNMNKNMFEGLENLKKMFL